MKSNTRKLKPLLTLLLTFLVISLSRPAKAHLAHHWHLAGSMTPVSVLVGGATSLWALSVPGCTVTDADASVFEVSTAPNNATIAAAACYLALKINPSAACSINVTTNTYVCTGEVNPASCTIHASGNKVTCT